LEAPAAKSRGSGRCASGHGTAADSQRAEVDHGAADPVKLIDRAGGGGDAGAIFDREPLEGHSATFTHLEHPKLIAAADCQVGGARALDREVRVDFQLVAVELDGVISGIQI